MQLFKFFRSACLLCLYFSCVLVLYAQSVPSIEEICDAVSAQESKLRNLKVESRLYIETYDETQNQWVKTGEETVCTAWYNGLPGSKARVDVHSEIASSSNEQVPLIQNSYTTSFNGKYGTLIEYSSGIPGKEKTISSADLVPESPANLHSAFMSKCTGASFSLFLRLNENGKLFSDLLKECIPSDSGIKISQEKFENVNCIRITGGDLAGDHESYWLDPSRGYALIGYRLINGGVVRQSITVSKLIEAGPNIWYPTETTYMESSRHGQLRFQYHAQNVTANDPAFDDAVFTPELPDDYTIHDKIVGVVYKTSKNPIALQESLDSITLEALNKKSSLEEATNEIAVGTNQAPNGSNDTMQETDSYEKGSEAATQRHKGAFVWVYVGIITGVLLLAATVVAKTYRINNSKASIFLVFFILIYSTHPCAAANNTDIVSIQQSTWISNCGVNSAYVLLRLFGIETTIPEVAFSTKAGERHENQLSLLDLKKLFEKHNLKVEGLNTPNIKETIDSCRNDTILVIHLQKMLAGRMIGHFVVAVPAAQGAILIDPPMGPVYVSDANLEETFLMQQATGKVLLVTRPKSEKKMQGVPEIWIPETDINLGDIPLAEREVLAEINYENIGNGLLKILDIKGGCSCYKGFTGSTECGPGKKGIIAIKFNKSMLLSDSQRVAIITNDPQHNIIPVTIRYHIQREPKNSDIRFFLNRLILEGR